MNKALKLNDGKGLKKSTKYIINASLIVLIFALVFLVDVLSDSKALSAESRQNLVMLTTVLKKGAVYAVVAVSMNLLNGFTGLFSLGQAGFMLLGAYTYAVFTIPLDKRESVYKYFDGGVIKFVLPVVVAIILAGIVAAIFAFLIGLPVLKLKSDYLAIATLGFAEILRAFMQWENIGGVTNASNQLNKFPKYTTVLPYFIIAAICITIIVLLIRSTYGRALKAIRDDEIAAEAMGINLSKHKRMSFVVSSFFAGIGGAMLAMFQTTVQANAFKSAMTYEILLIVVIGGIGSVTGSIISSFLFISCSEWWLRFLDNETVVNGSKIPLLGSGFRMVVFSVVIMIIVLFFSRGIMGTKEFSVDAIYKWIRKLFTPKNKKAEAEHK